MEIDRVSLLRSYLIVVYWSARTGVELRTFSPLMPAWRYIGEVVIAKLLGM